MISLLTLQTIWTVELNIGEKGVDRTPEPSAESGSRQWDPRLTELSKHHCKVEVRTDLLVQGLARRNIQRLFSSNQFDDEPPVNVPPHCGRPCRRKPTGQPKILFEIVSITVVRCSAIVHSPIGMITWSLDTADFTKSGGRSVKDTCVEKE